MVGRGGVGWERILASGVFFLRGAFSDRSGGRVNTTYGTRQGIISDLLYTKHYNTTRLDST